MLFSEMQVRQLGQVIREVAREEIMPRFRQLSEGQVQQKSSAQDLVTVADVAAERKMTALLRSRFPSAQVIGEEAVAADARLLRLLSGADMVIILDPIDGTKNFASGLPLFGVIAAVVVAGEVVAGAIYDPVLDDFAYALRGVGAWTEASGGQRTDLRVAGPRPIGDMSGFASWRALPEPRRHTVASNLSRFAVVNSHRCVAHEYRVLCAGHTDFSMYAKMMPWDHAAGWLMHREAGGYAARLDGSDYLPRHTEGGILYAADRDSWNRIHATLFGADQRLVSAEVVVPAAL